MDSCPIAVTPRSSTRNLTVSSDHAGNSLRLKRSGLVSQSLYMSVRSAAKAPVGILPGLEVGDREGVVGILGEEGRVVEHHQRQDHLLHRDFVHGDAVLGEMRRRVPVGAVLAGPLVEGGAKARFRDGV